MIYIQKNNDGIPHHFDCTCAMYGAIDFDKAPMIKVLVLDEE